MRLEAGARREPGLVQRSPLRGGVGRGAAPLHPHRGTEPAGPAQWQEVEVALVGRLLFSVQ